VPAKNRVLFDTLTVANFSIFFFLRFAHAPANCPCREPHYSGLDRNLRGLEL